MKFLPEIFTANIAAFLFVLLFASYSGAAAPGPKVSELGNRHNLSAIARQVGTTTLVPNTNTYRATGDITSNPGGQQICIFCHTPHNANVAEQAPLWNRKFSSVVFQRYTGSATFNIKNLAAAGYGAGAQPNGSSKLCLSCHDGVASMGDVLRGGPIDMSKNVIDGIASFNPSTNKMRYGHHPVSFVYATGYAYNSSPESQTGSRITGLPVDYVFPQKIDGNIVVKLKDTTRDGRGWMQCTTCHDPHQNQANESDCYGGVCDGTNTRKKVPFWVYHKAGNTSVQDHDAVCTACHNLTTPAPWPSQN
ncbi:hypothetical protein [Pelotalea chapellei]|uniref:Doubled CXXCH motif domain-containing protein n=1 Tax=Pelotalea chapellei TaxID=44671 RepID=A0ABS5U6Y0_9BACT|nr:hypothetical protein [Pelotalea chapellei]MBT1071430.1 hypothetical protein [Pelotalea chapellei]